MSRSSHSSMRSLRILAPFQASVRRSLVVFLPILLAVAVGSVHAGDTKYAGEFLRLGVGARALGMGGSYVALANDASAAYWNPAGLATLQHAEMLLDGAVPYCGFVDINPGLQPGA